MTNKTYNPLLIESVKATTNLPAHRFVDFEGNLCAAGHKALGVVDVSTDAEELAPVIVLGVALVEAGGNISIGNQVSSDNEGKAILQERVNLSNGFALDAGSSGDLIRIVRGI